MNSFFKRICEILPKQQCSHIEPYSAQHISLVIHTHRSRIAHMSQQPLSTLSNFLFQLHMYHFIHINLHECPRDVTCDDMSLLHGINQTCQEQGFDDYSGRAGFLLGLINALFMAVCTFPAFILLHHFCFRNIRYLEHLFFFCGELT